MIDPSVHAALEEYLEEMGYEQQNSVHMMAVTMKNRYGGLLLVSLRSDCVVASVRVPIRNDLSGEETQQFLDDVFVYEGERGRLLTWTDRYFVLSDQISEEELEEASVRVLEEALEQLVERGCELRALLVTVARMSKGIKEGIYPHSWFTPKRLLEFYRLSDSMPLRH